MAEQETIEEIAKKIKKNSKSQRVAGIAMWAGITEAAVFGTFAGLGIGNLAPIAALSTLTAFVGGYDWLLRSVRDSRLKSDMSQIKDAERDEEFRFEVANLDTDRFGSIWNSFVDAQEVGKDTRFNILGIYDFFRERAVKEGLIPNQPKED